MRQEEEAGDGMGLPHSQSLKKPFDHLFPFFPKVGGAGNRSRERFGFGRKDPKSKVGFLGDFRAGGEGVETKNPFLESNNKKKDTE